MDVYKTHGAFSWSELTTSDPAAAAIFYGALFGWNIGEPLAEMGDYRVVSVGDKSVAGIMAPPPGSSPASPAPSYRGCYDTVESVDLTLERVTSLGGRVLVPAMDVPGVGRMGVLQDPQGAVISVMHYAMPG